jgi:predicted TIM-barrel fold metal-dependent hydrolase
MRLFDCNCCLGVPGGRGGMRFARSAAELIEEMDFCGVDRALVYHAAMRYDSPVVGNDLLQAEMGANPRLVPTLAILPSQTGEIPEPEKFLEVMRALGARALRVFAAEHRYALDANTMGDWFAMMEERRIPLLAKTDCLTLANVLASFPKLVVVAMSQGPHSLERYLRPIVERYPTFYIDTASYMVDGLIESFCRRYGAGRLLFGTGYPDNCSGAALLRLVQADISPEDKETIGWHNLARILEEVRL